MQQYPKLWTVQLKVAQFSVYTQWTTLIGDNLLPEEATYTALEDEGLNFKKIKNGMFEDRNGKILPDGECDSLNHLRSMSFHGIIKIPRS